MHRLSIPFLITALLLIIKGDLYSNTLADVDSPYIIQRISPIGGICYGGIKDNKQDSRGFIWVISDSELLRFDGYTFKRYTNRLQEVNSIMDWTIMSLEIDDKDCLYIGLRDGVVRYDTRHDKMELIHSELAGNLLFDGKDKLWILGHDVGYYDLCSNEYNRVTTAEKEDIADATSICSDKKDIYIGTRSGRIYIKSEEQPVSTLLPGRRDMIVDLQCKNDKLYILYEESGLSIIDKNRQEEISFYNFFTASNSHMPSKSILIDRLNRIWMATQKGLYLIDEDARTYSYINSESDVMKQLLVSSVWRLREDSQGNIWFGTYAGGLYFIDFNRHSPFSTYSLGEHQLNCSIVSCIVEDGNTLWIGTEGGGINKMNLNSGEFSYIRQDPKGKGLSYNNVKSMLLHENRLWIASFRGGLDCYDINSGRFTNYNAMQPSKPLMVNHVYKIAEKRDKGFMLYYRGLKTVTYYSHETKEFTHHDLVDDKQVDILGRRVVDITDAGGDKMWIATDMSIYTFDVNTRKISTVPMANSVDLLNLRINSIVAGNTPNIVWIGTNDNGLWCYDKDKKQLKLCVDLTPYQAHSINSLICDIQGCVWIGSDNGLFCYNPQNQKILMYNKSDDIQGDMFNIFASAISKTGKLYFGGTEGLTIVDPEHIVTNKLAPQTILTELYIDGVIAKVSDKKSPLKQIISDTKHLTLNYDQRNFSIEFTSNNYVASKKNRFKYSLKRYDTRVIESDASHRQASYSKISSGEYIFEISTANNDGVWGSVKQLHITVRPPWWFSTVAIIIYSLLFLSLLWAIIYSYEKKKKRQLQRHIDEIERKQKEDKHREQLNFFTNVSHDFRTPLSLIIAALDSMSAEVQQQRLIVVIRNSAKRLLNMVNELLDFRVLQDGQMRVRHISGNWNEFVRERSMDFGELAKQKGVLLNISLDANMPDKLYFDHKIAEKILLNLLNNSVKYTTQGEISVKTLYNVNGYRPKYDKYISIEPDNGLEKITFYGVVISDSGVGISEDSISNVFERYFRIDDSSEKHIGSGIGLALVKSLVVLLQGQLILSSRRDVGTEIIVLFPQIEHGDEQSDDMVDFISEKFNPHNIIDPETASLRDNAKSNNHNSAKLNIMLVEDNAQLRELVGDMLMDEFNVVSCSNGQEALNLVENNIIALVITDLMMPVMDGISLCMEIKSRVETSHIPIIMLTASVGIESEIKGLKVGADAYIGKPVNREHLMLSVKNILAQRERLRKFYLKNILSDSDLDFENTKDNQFMSSVTKYIEDNISDSTLDVKTLASQLLVSHSNLYSKVKALTGLSPVELIRKYRLNKAAKMLLESKFTISEIIDHIGIESISYFSRAFKKEFGETPSEYQRRRK